MLLQENKLLYSSLGSGVLPENKYKMLRVLKKKMNIKQMQTLTSFY